MTGPVTGQAFVSKSAEFVLEKTDGPRVLSPKEVEALFPFGLFVERSFQEESLQKKEGVLRPFFSERDFRELKGPVLAEEYLQGLSLEERKQQLLASCSHNDDENLKLMKSGGFLDGLSEEESQRIFQKAIEADALEAFLVLFSASDALSLEWFFHQAATFGAKRIFKWFFTSGRVNRIQASSFFSILELVIKTQNIEFLKSFFAFERIDWKKNGQAILMCSIQNSLDEVFECLLAAQLDFEPSGLEEAFCLALTLNDRPKAQRLFESYSLDFIDLVTLYRSCRHDEMLQWVKENFGFRRRSKSI
ncbi:MAG: hypothetical protein WC371_00710 [Parachlamydiales bacterium]|jgi:hypothetical protein